MGNYDMITRLEEIIAGRKSEMPEGSYTTYLFTQGQDKILKKVGEEAAETIIASKNDNRTELVYEASDLIYHLLVLLAHHEISWAEIEAELERRYIGGMKDEG
ncbi:MAG TPA: phosphoribosyl-ATP diphosphatase [Ardenticatenaceae bacterium]|jgi:phosphoribosyl-ATP pyrophosphohydrolase